MSKYRILSLDGGGIRGVLSAQLLARLDKMFPDFLDQIDLIAGNSTGGIQALGLAAGLRPKELLRLYMEYGPRVFADSPEDDARDLGRLIGADYDNEPLRQTILELLGNLRLRELDKRVLIATFDLDNGGINGRQRRWKPKFFHNFPGDESDGCELVVDVALRTSAAPTYFPIYQGYVDGGVVVNNPSMCAVAQALHPETGGQKLDRLVLLSLGTGVNPRYLTQQHADWGVLQWAPHLVSIATEGGAGMAHYQCRQVLGERYLRVNATLPEPIGMDRVDKVDLLKEMADQVDLQPAALWMARHWS